MFPLVEFESGEGRGKYQCPVDQASMQIVQMVLTETAIKPISLFGSGLAAYIIKLITNNQEKWRPPFKESEEIVWLLYYMMVNFFASIFFPFSVLVQPLAIYFLFWVYYWYVMHIAEKSIS